jgi:nicotinamidase-related amidase
LPLTTLDPQTALIVVDLQQGIVNLPAVHPISEVVERSCALLAAFRSAQLPVVLVNVAGRAPGRTEEPPRQMTLPPDWTNLIPELNPQPTDILITKRTWGAFAGTGLEDQLKQRGVTQVVIAGVATGTGVESTARQAYELGFNVTLAIDAMTDIRAEAHAWAIERVFPRIGETGTSPQILHLLSTRSNAE